MPSAGYRRTLTGAVGGVGGEGLCWSSSSFGGSGNSYDAGYLYFHSDRLDPLNANNRSYGFSVRCVQHLRGIVSDAALLKLPDKKRSLDPEWRRLRLLSVRSVDSTIH